jgi:ElaB/YqjD/DUF883 family membrane-anchored ribosome-binding protein
MDAPHDLAEPTSDEMRQEIDGTRSAMADKLEALENRVMDTVESARETVQDSIQSAKDTVATVKRTFDVKHQVQQHPWAMVGGCFLAGLALGNLLPRGRQQSQQASDRVAGNEMPPAGSHRLSAERRTNGSLGNAAPPPRPDSMSVNRPGFFGQFHEEIDKVKGMAIGYVMGLIQEAIKDTAPQLASQIDGVMNGITVKLGGEPVQQRSH